MGVQPTSPQKNLGAPVPSLSGTWDSTNPCKPLVASDRRPSIQGSVQVGVVQSFLGSLPANGATRNLSKLATSGLRLADA